MGMFDYVRCEVPLPDGFTGELQTKDFCNDMVTHTITADGRLLLERIDRVEEVPKAERPYPDAPDDDLRSIFGSIRTFTSSSECEFHGIMNFYGSEGDSAIGTHKWHEYNAKFTDGKLVEITQIE